MIRSVGKIRSVIVALKPPRIQWNANDVSMRQKRRNSWFLLFGLIGLSGLGWYVNNVAPNSFQALLIFFVTFFLSSSLILLYFLNNVRRGLLLSVGIVTYLLLRLLNLREPLYVLLLIACLASLELYFKKR